MRVSLFWINYINVAKRCKNHCHPFWEIVYLSGSDGYIQISGKRYPYKDGDVSVHPPGQIHSVYNEKPAAHYCLGIDGDELSVIPFTILKPDESLKNSFLSLAEEVSTQDQYHDLIIDGIASQIIWKLVRQYRKEAGVGTGRKSSKVASVKEFIDTDYKRPDLNLEIISQKVLLNKDSIRHLFKKEYGTSPIQYLIRKKIEHSKALLAESDHRIHLIASEIGFGSDYYFSRMFKKLTGMTPSQYRDRNSGTDS